MRDYLLDVLHPHLRGIRTIQKQVADRHGITVDELLSPRRCARYVRARQEAMAACYERPEWSLPQIGLMFRRHHTTVLHGAMAHMERAAAGLEQPTRRAA